MRCKKNDPFRKIMNEACKPSDNLESFTPQVMQRINIEKPFVRHWHKTPLPIRIMLSPLPVIAGGIITGWLYREELTAWIEVLTKNELIARLLNVQAFHLCAAMAGLITIIIGICTYSLSQRR